MIRFIKCIFAIILICMLTSCAVSTDPRQGGFIGGLSGISSGAYENRVQQRNADLASKKNLNSNLQQESQGLKNEVQSQKQILASDQQQLAKMERNLASLESDIKRFSASSAKQNAELAAIRSKSKDLQKQVQSQKSAALVLLNQADKCADDNAPCKSMELETTRLSAEYKQLMRYYQALSEASN